MIIGDENIGQYEVEYTAEEVADIHVAVNRPQRWWELTYLDDEDIRHMPPDAPEEFKKEFAAFAWREVWLYSQGICID